MTRILLTNDDGYKSLGFLPLLRELSKEFSVTPIAPDRGKSWVGKAITTKKELKVKKVKRGSFDIFTFNGTPADCVQIGLYEIMHSRPDLVVSGVNIGENVGNARILSSGTVGAAMEASLDGIKALAVSIAIPLDIKKTIDFSDTKNYGLFDNAAQITTKISTIVLANTFDDAFALISVNIPFTATIDSEVEITRPFLDPYGKLFHKTGNGLIHSTPPVDFTTVKKGTDARALRDGKISVTPISLSLVSEGSIAKITRIIQNAW